MARYYLARANIGRFRGPIESDIMEGFRVQLDPVNAIADQSPGFVWRLTTNTTPRGSTVFCDWATPDSPPQGA